MIAFGRRDRVNKHHQAPLHGPSFGPACCQRAESGVGLRWRWAPPRWPCTSRSGSNHEWRSSLKRRAQHAGTGIQERSGWRSAGMHWRWCWTRWTSSRTERTRKWTGCFHQPSHQTGPLMWTGRGGPQVRGPPPASGRCC